jgi:hypothetical protein
MLQAGRRRHLRARFTELPLIATKRSVENKEIELTSTFVAFLVLPFHTYLRPSC